MSSSDIQHGAMPDPISASLQANRAGWATGALVALIGYYWFTAHVRTDLHLLLGLFQIVLAALPSLLWLRRGRGELPVFEVLMLTGVNAYALPLLNGHQALAAYAAEDITLAALAVLAFQVAALFSYLSIQGRVRSSPFWRENIISGGAARWMLLGLALSTAYIVASTFTGVVPNSLQGLLRAIFYGIGIVSTFVTARRLGARELTQGEQAFFATALLIQCVAMTATLFLVGAVSLLMLALVGYVSGSRRVPLLYAAAVLVVLAVLHNGKAPMREKYWEDDMRVTPRVTQLPAFFAEWIGHGTQLQDGEDDTHITTKLIDRTSLFHILCLVVAYSPDQQPYLGGETYKDVPAQFVPRLFWSGKPSAHASTTRLSVYYGLQTEEETTKTTIGFGMLAEAYANFGLLGIAALGALLGSLIKKVQCWGADSPMLSGGGLILVVLLAWSFQTEFTLSMWVSSLFQACVAVLIVPFALRTFAGQ